MTLSLKLVVASTRPGRAADLVLPWLAGELTTDGRFDVEVMDLRDWKLPFFQEHAGSIGDPSAPTYSEPIVKRWNDTMSSGDVVVVLTPEYNHSIPGELKNALDSLYLSHALRNKPLGIVSYTASGTGGARAVEHLVQILQNFECVALRSAVLVGGVAIGFRRGSAPDVGRTGGCARGDDRRSRLVGERAGPTPGPPASWPTPSSASARPSPAAATCAAPYSVGKLGSRRAGWRARRRRARSRSTVRSGVAG